MSKNVYRCPHEASCSLKKHCRALTTSEKLKEPLSLWIVCPEMKKETGGKETERLVRITEENRAA